MLGYFRVSIIHRTLTGTAGSLTCTCDLFASVYTRNRVYTVLSAAFELTHCANVFLVYAGFVFNIVVLTESWSQSVSHLTDIVYMARVFSVCWICLQHCCID